MASIVIGPVVRWRDYHHRFNMSVREDHTGRAFDKCFNDLVKRFDLYRVEQSLKTEPDL